MLLAVIRYVTALFTSVPIEDATKIIQRKLETGSATPPKTIMKVEHITCLLEFCLKTAYFQFQGNFYEQISGAAMGSPISPIVANLFIEEFEVRAIQTAKNPPKMWKRYVDDTCVILKSANKEEFFHHINHIDHRNSIYIRRIQARWVNPLPGLPGNTTSRWFNFDSCL